MTFDTLPAPLALLQARNYDSDGLKQIVLDIVNIAGLRTPSNYPNLDSVLAQASDFLTARRESADIDSKTDAKPAVANQKSDPELHEMYDNLVTRLRHLMVQVLASARPAFDIPPDEELLQMDLSELTEVASAVNVAYPTMALVEISMWDLSEPKLGLSKWRRMNAMKRLEKLSRVLDKYEKSL